LALGRVVSRDFANYRVLDRLGLYERRIEHSLYRTMGELQKLRLLRELDPPMEAESTPKPASRTEDEPLRQTNPISPFSAPKTGFEGQGKANQSVGQGKLVRSSRYESCPGLKSRVSEIHQHGSVRGVEACFRVRSGGTLETERQEQKRTQA